MIKQRTDPRTLPGVEAMMPGSALTRLLHLPQLSTSADLSVICGDVQGKGLFGQLKILALDWFYGSDHDLVVNTGSMLGGIARAGGAARFRRDEGEQGQPLPLLQQPQVDSLAGRCAGARGRQRCRLRLAGRGAAGRSRAGVPRCAPAAR